MVLPQPGSSKDGESGFAGFTNTHRRFHCGECGFFQDVAAASAAIGCPVDPYFRRPLWLQASCCGHVLWAYNARHLDLLEAYVAARLRERGRTEPLAPMSLVERLPAWLKAAKNRSEVLKTIRRLRATLPAEG